MLQGNPFANTCQGFRRKNRKKRRILTLYSSFGDEKQRIINKIG